MLKADASLMKSQRNIADILRERFALPIPYTIVIDITNRCNCNCIACWTYSPLLGAKKAGSQWRGHELSLGMIRSLTDELKILGTREIRLTGGGEPFLHKDILSIIEYIKSKRITCSVTTNGTLLTKETVDQLIQMQLDVLTVSIWAADGKTYAQTHPNKSPETFEHIAEMLHYLKSHDGPKPLLVIANVISNENYHNIDLMIDFALDVGAHEIYFALVDPLENATDALLLSEEQRAFLTEKLSFYQNKFRNTDYFKIDCVEITQRRLNAKNSSAGEYDYEIINTIPCYAGWVFARVMADGNISPCCRGVHIPIGNIYQERFTDIWLGEKANTFRTMALNGNKYSQKFKEIGCTKTCDNFPQNEWIHNQIDVMTKSKEKRSLL